MPVNKRKKNSRQKGSYTYGWGSKKKHRKAGNRGGHGMSGTGKRSDHRKTMILKQFGHAYFGKTGFKRPQKVLLKIKTINVQDLNKFKEDKINLLNLGYNKLLGKGNINKKITVIVPKFSESAKEKIEKAGGQVLEQ
ncbi:MAG: uL15 family ribosomal protein [Nanoarchaeota archaeon]